MTSPFRESEHPAKVAEYERQLSELAAQRAWLDGRLAMERPARPSRIFVLVVMAFLLVPLVGFCGSFVSGTFDRTDPRNCPGAATVRSGR
jgi:hypothetical protein